MKIEGKNITENKGQILIRNKKGILVKVFKTWYDDKTELGTIQLVFKDDDGKKQKIYKQYKSASYRHRAGKDYMPANMMLWEAVVKYWPGFEISNHFIYHTYGHTYKVEKKKPIIKKGNGRNPPPKTPKPLPPKLKKKKLKKRTSK